MMDIVLSEEEFAACRKLLAANAAKVRCRVRSRVGLRFFGVHALVHLCRWCGGIWTGMGQVRDGGMWKGRICWCWWWEEGRRERGWIIVVE
jgi:hypothetical protein